MKHDGEAQHRVFLAKIPPHMTEADLRGHFEQFGEITDLYLPLSPDRCNHKGIGFVTYKDEATVTSVLKSPSHNVGGSMIVADKAGPRSESRHGRGEPVQPVEEKGVRVFVTKVAPEHTQRDLEEYFTQFGPVVDVYVPASHPGSAKHKGIAFVSYAEPSAASKVLEKTDHLIGSSTVVVDRAVDREQSGKGKGKGFKGGKGMMGGPYGGPYGGGYGAGGGYGGAYGMPQGQQGYGFPSFGMPDQQSGYHMGGQQGDQNGYGYCGPMYPQAPQQQYGDVMGFGYQQQQQQAAGYGGGEMYAHDSMGGKGYRGPPAWDAAQYAQQQQQQAHAHQHQAAQAAAAVAAAGGQQQAPAYNQMQQGGAQVQQMAAPGW